ncbi:MAG TPA: hypothetical protein DEG69_19460 [Flavobacteriaceae bacterium]|nr:hypothetical protein [Flavobacteriaceae bacterium]
MGISKRKFIRSLPARGDISHRKGTVYLVYTYKDSKLSSGPPYHDETIAMESMRKFLSNGTCSWVVSYNA